MERQKRIALINDITGFGRCSVTVELPLISALKVQACPFPTALLSVHTGFPSHYIDDCTDRMRPYMENWKENGLTFDGIATGFIGSAAQIGIVIDFIEMFRTAETKVMVDPVMGDNGRLYASYTPEMCREMRRLLHYADLVTPNLTEACELLELPYPEDGAVTDEELLHMARALSDAGPAQVVITGRAAAISSGISFMSGAGSRRSSGSGRSASTGPVRATPSRPSWRPLSCGERRSMRRSPGPRNLSAAC